MRSGRDAKRGLTYVEVVVVSLILGMFFVVATRIFLTMKNMEARSHERLNAAAEFQAFTNRIWPQLIDSVLINEPSLGTSSHRLSYINPEGRPVSVEVQDGNLVGIKQDGSRTTLCRDVKWARFKNTSPDIIGIGIGFSTVFREEYMFTAIHRRSRFNN